MVMNSKRVIQGLLVQVKKRRQHFKGIGKAAEKKNTMVEERQKALENSRKLLKLTEDQIRLKELRIKKLKSTNEFKKCDDVTCEFRALLKDKRELDLYK